MQNNSQEVLFFSANSEIKINDKTYANEDIIAYDGDSYKQYFDGSDVGIANVNINALDILNDEEILLSFSSPTELVMNGVTTLVDDSDIVKFTSNQMGKATAGSFEMFFDGSENGLTEDLQDIDGITLLEDGSIAISTIGSSNITGDRLTRDEDIVRIDRSNLENPWSVYFDGSDVELNTTNSEDVNGFTIDNEDLLNLTTKGDFIVRSVEGDNLIGNSVSVIEFEDSSLGNKTAGTFNVPPIFDGAASGISNQNINAFDLEDSIDLNSLDSKLNSEIDLLLELQPSIETDSIVPSGKNFSFFSIDIKTDIDGQEYRDEDILFFDGEGLKTYFDGSDVGIGNIDVDAFDIIDDSEILLSFSTPTTVSIDGEDVEVDDSDVVKFMGSQMGDTTEGEFEMFFDGSEFDLTEDLQDIDAVQLLDDGSLLVSTIGTSTIVEGVSSSDEDILRVQPNEDTSDPLDTWSVFLDGGDIGLYSLDSEDVNAISLGSQGDIYLSTIGDAEVTNSMDEVIAASNVKVLQFSPFSLGSETAGNFQDDFIFDGSDFGLSAQNIDAFSLETTVDL